MTDPLFLNVEDILYIHRREIELAGGQYLMDLFDMAAAYLVALVFRHPFLDGNKRTAAAAALTFLHLNGYAVNERHPEELAVLVLSLLRREVDREDVRQWFRDRSTPHESAEPS